jgi:hypothetical protein
MVAEEVSVDEGGMVFAAVAAKGVVLIVSISVFCSSSILAPGLSPRMALVRRFQGSGVAFLRTFVRTAIQSTWVRLVRDLAQRETCVYASLRSSIGRVV